MFKGFSAIEQLLKVAGYNMPEHKKLIDDAAIEHKALKEAAQQKDAAEVDGACTCPRKENGIHLASCLEYYPFGTPRL